MRLKRTRLIENSSPQKHILETNLIKKPHYYSCSIPNTFKEDYIHNNLDRESNSSIEGSKKTKIFLVVFFFFCFGFYAYVVADINPATIFWPASNSHPGRDKASCFEEFRRQNCTLNKPMGLRCEELHSCVSKGYEPVNSVIKMEKI